MGYEVSDFVADVDRILDDRGPTVEAIWEMGPRLQRLVARGRRSDQAGRGVGGEHGAAQQDNSRGPTGSVQVRSGQLSSRRAYPNP